MTQGLQKNNYVQNHLLQIDGKTSIFGGADIKNTKQFPQFFGNIQLWIQAPICSPFWCTSEQNIQILSPFITILHRHVQLQ